MMEIDLTKVMIVEDHALVRQSLANAISADPDFEVVGEIERGDEVLAAVAANPPDMILLDIGIPGQDGLQVATQLKESSPDLSILFLTMHDDEATIREVIDIGAAGFIDKNASTEELLQALRVVAAGGSYLSPAIAKRVLDLAAKRTTGGTSRLTDRELQILGLLTEGLRAREIAAQLFLSEKTIKNHLTSIYAKMGVQTAAQAVASAYRRGVVATPN